MRVLLLLLLAAPASSAIYEWKDEKGVTHFSSKPPKDEKLKRSVFVPKHKGPAGRSAPDMPSQPPAAPGETPAPVELFTTSWCGYCGEARSWLAARGVAYRELDIEKDASAYSRYRSLGGNGVPLAVIKGTTVRGWSAAEYERLLK